MKLSNTIQKKELERLIVELSWKSSQIEGNTYTLLDTEALLKNHIEASGHSKEESVMILNHKKALEFVIENHLLYKKLTLNNIEHLHRLLLEGLDSSADFRRFPVGIVGTKYQPLDNVFQIKEAVERVNALVNVASHPAEKALLALALTSYIQPFEDGNKRTARLLANALLFAYDYCPLSYRNVSEADYKKAVLLFHEKHNLNALKKIFIEQFQFAVENYFRA